MCHLQIHPRLLRSSSAKLAPPTDLSYTTRLLSPKAILLSNRMWLLGPLSLSPRAASLIRTCSDLGPLQDHRRRHNRHQLPQAMAGILRTAPRRLPTHPHSTARHRHDPNRRRRAPPRPVPRHPPKIHHPQLRLGRPPRHPRNPHLQLFNPPAPKLSRFPRDPPPAPTDNPRRHQGHARHGRALPLGG